MKNTRLKKIIATILCICTVISSMMILSSCNKENEEETITVLRFIENMEMGKRVTSAKVQEITVSKSEAPEGTLELTADALTDEVLYTALPVFAGDYVVEGKTTKEKPVVEDDKKPIVGITDQNTDDYVIANSGSGDLYENLQKLIDDNPNKTIYFPDGVYNVSKPLVISTSPEKRVSLRLSQYAVIAVYNTTAWTKNAPVIHFGAGETVEEKDNDGVGAKAFITGGTIDAKKVATAIKVEGAGNIIIHHMALKNVTTGIHVLTNNVHIDSITGTGNSTYESIGMLIEGSHNKMTNFRMCQIHYGIKLTKGQNIMRNLHPLISTMSESSTSIGFWDLSEGNFYDYCYSDQFATAFKLADGNSSVLNGCYAYWWSERGNIHYGIHVEGKFDGVIYGTRIDMCHPDEVDNAYIKVNIDGGDGKIVHPIVGNGGTSNDNYKSHFDKYVDNY